MTSELTQFDQAMADRARMVRQGLGKGAMGHEAAKAHRVAEAMLADGDKLLNRACLMGHARNFGLSRNNWRGFGHLQDWYNSSMVGLLQIPSEFVDFLLYCARYRPATMLEIGAFTGGSTFLAAAFFKAINPEFRLTTIDLGDYILLEQRTIDLLGIDIRAGTTSEDIYGTAFDVVFVDGDHSYGWAKSDFLNVGRFANNVCGMHDITGREYLHKGGGIFAYWRELRHSLCHHVPIYQIGHAAPGMGNRDDGDWMGIGVLDLGHLSAEDRAVVLNLA